MVTSGGKSVLYNMYLPNNRHGPRLARKVEDVYAEIAETKIPAKRNYLVIEVMGTITATGADFIMPPVKYIFRQ